jgi:hypothetical protein
MSSTPRWCALARLRLLDQTHVCHACCPRTGRFGADAINTKALDSVDPNLGPVDASVDAWVATCFGSADYRDGWSAFREKRDPVFTGA